MSLHKLSAGSGYEYLTDQVATLDSTEKGAIPLADYYAAKGEAPGRWVGSELAGIDGVEAGDVVTAEQMKHLFGTGSHPLTGEPLGSPHKVYGSEGVDGFNAEVQRRVSASSTTGGGSTTGGRPPDELIAKIRSEVAREWFVREHEREPASERELSAALARYSRPRQTAVAGYDLTFSPVKSVSTLWAVAPPEVAKLIEQAHDAAVADALAYLEREVIFTREGANGARQVETRGLIATAFTHRDSRAGDPDLHTHVAVANKVQTRDGKWLSIYGKVLHQHVVAASETYNTALEHHLHALLGVLFATRPALPGGKRPVREVVGVDLSLCRLWSTRRADITKRQRELARDFTRAQGRPPTPVEAVALAQQANLETRQTKHVPRSEAEQRDAWLRQATDLLGSARLDAMIRAALQPSAPEPRQVSADWVNATTQRVLSELEAHQATWQSWHVYAEAQRQVRDVAIPPERVSDVVQLIVDSTEQLFVNLTPDRDPIAEPDALRRSDGTSVYRHTGRDHFTSARVLEAEERLVAAAGMNGAFSFDPEEVEITIRAAAVEGDRLNRGQRDLVLAMAGTDSRVRLALAPAGSGKTTAMKVLAQVWTDRGYDAIGLTPSAAAAAVLTEAAEIFSETLAKLDHHISTGRFEGWAAGIGPHTLIVIDEAGMADTLTLDRVVGFCLARGATVRLIGDDQQLAAIGAGGVLRDIAHLHGADRLDEVVRFAVPAEAAASLDLREGDPAALGYYLDHDRVHVGDTETCVEAVFDSWIRGSTDGRDCLMLAPTRDLVAELNARARAVRLNGTKPRTEVPLRDGNQASIGDTIITRHNDRRLGVSGTDWVKNGDRWTITGVHAGALTVRHTGSGLTTILPAQYVAAHVDLGYASTVHSAQGLTADAMHGIVTGEESRQLLYTMLTRGRSENHAHVVLAAPTDPHQLALPGLGEQLTATEMLEGILARDGAAVSATTTAVLAARVGAQLHEAVVRYADAVALGAQRVLGSGWEDELDAADAGPLPWLPSIPADVARHETWGPYLEARAQRVRTLADGFRSQPRDTLPTWAELYADVLDGALYGEVALWRAAQGVPDEDRRLAGPPPEADAVAAYHRALTTRINQRYTDIVRDWESKIVEHVGHSDDQTLQLARELDRLQRTGHDAERLLHRAAARKPLPDDHPTAALAYRIRNQIKPRRAAPAEPPPYRSAPSLGPGLGL